MFLDAAILKCVASRVDILLSQAAAEQREGAGRGDLSSNS